MDIQQYIISNLKRQPRHGQTPPNNQSGWEQFKDLIESSIDSVDGLTDSAAALGNGLGKLIGFTERTNQQYIELIKNITFLEERNSALNKTFGLTSVGAEKFAKSLRNIGKDIGIGDKLLFQYANQLKGITGGFISSAKVIDKQFNKSLIAAQAYLQNNIKVTEKASIGYQLYAAGIGDSAEQALAKQNKLAEALSATTGIETSQIQRDITEEIGNLAADLQLQYSRIPGNLELAVLKSKQLGVSMEQLHKSGKGLLNVEQSVTAEQEFQLLSGKRLLTQRGESLTNAFRMAVVEGDLSKQADLMNDFLAENGDLLSKNLYAREAAAKLFGMEESQLARSIQQRKLFNDLSAAAGQDISELLKQQNGNIEATAALLKEKGISEDEIKKFKAATDTKTTAEKQLDALESINSNIIKSLGVSVSSTAASAGKIFSGQQALMSGLSGGAGTVLQNVLGYSANVVTAGNNVTAAIKDLGEQIPGVSLAVTSLTSFMESKYGKYIDAALGFIPEVGKSGQTNMSVTPVNDTLIFPDKGPILRPAKNDVIAAFRPGDVIDRTMSGGGNINYNMLATAIASAMQNVKVQATVRTDDLFSATKLNGGLV